MSTDGAVLGLAEHTRDLIGLGVRALIAERALTAPDQRSSTSAPGSVC